MARVLALVDGSIYTESVCDHAAWLAQRRDAAVELLHVLERRETGSVPANLGGSLETGISAGLLEQLRDLDEEDARLARKRGRAILESAMARIEGAGVRQVSARLIFGGLVQAVAECGTMAEAVVIGKRGEETDLSKRRLGSNLERLIRSCRRPVFVAARGSRSIERLLIVLNSSACSMSAVEYIAQSNVFCGAHCRLLTIGTEVQEGYERLETARAVLEAGGFAVDGTVFHGPPERALRYAMASDRTDLLVLTAHGRSRIRHFFAGSVTTEPVRSCGTSVLLFR